MPSPRAGRRRLTTTVRLIDPSVASNRLVAAAFAGVLAAMFALRLAGTDDTATQAAGAALAAALAVFLGWAIARELDPDRPVAASVSIAATLVVLLAGEPRLGAVIALLLAVRIVAGTTGRAPTALDLVWLPAVAAYAGLSPGGIVAGLALAVALALDAASTRRAWSVAAAVAAAAGTLAVAVAGDTIGPDPRAPDALQWILLAAGAFGAALMLARCPPPTSLGDLSREPLSRTRLLRARQLAVAVAIGTLAWLGGPAIAALASLSAAVVAVGLTPRRSRR